MKLARTQHRRRGTILIVVLALLALFAVIGLSFVLYSGSEATASRIHREAQDLGTTPPNPDGELAALQALADLIYDTTDDQAGMYSSLRGHGLARGKYGWFYTGTVTTPTADATMNTSAYAGVGPIESPNYLGSGVPRSRFLNFSWFPGTVLFGFPERIGSIRTPASNALAINTLPYVGKHANYTYPDANNLFLGLANPLNGQVLVPSFHRPWIFGSLIPPGQPGANTNWTNAQGKYMTLRPRPADNNGFPNVPPNADGTFTGDVQNLAGALYPFLKNPTLNPGDPNSWAPNAANPILIPKNDSIWVDTGAQVQYWNGKRYKPLFAFLILPLDNRVNLSASGNLRGLSPTNVPVHDSGQGIGQWEISPLRLFDDASRDPRANTEYQRMIADRFGSAQNTINTTPYSVQSPGPFTYPPAVGTTLTARMFASATPPDYAPFDWDGGAPADAMRLMLPGTLQPPHQPLSPFATTPRWNDPAAVNSSRYGNGDPTGTGEKDNHPSLFNPYFVGPVSMGFGHTLPVADSVKLNLKFGDDTGITSTSYLGQLAPFSFGTLATAPADATHTNTSFPVGRSPANTNRMNVTTVSNASAVAALMPNYAAYTGYSWVPNSPIPFPQRTANVPIVPGTPGVADAPTPAAGSPQQLRAVMSFLQGSVDLNRPLGEYRVNTNLPLSPANTTIALTNAAWADRQLLARDVFNRLVIATGASAVIDPAGSGYMIPSVAAGTPEFDALRYLAQLAVNIVDFIDADDVSTAFVWNPQIPADPLNVANFDPSPANAGYIGNRVVFGVEKPKLVPNEVYMEITNDPQDATSQTQTQGLQVRVWIELLNPATAELIPGKTAATKPAPVIDQITRLRIVTGDVINTQTVPAGVAVSPYQVHVYQKGSQVTTDMAARDNVTGVASASAKLAIRYDFSTIQPNERILVPNQGQPTNAGFALLGPALSAASPVEFDPKKSFPAGGLMIPVPDDTNPQPGQPVNPMTYQPFGPTKFNEDELILPTNLPALQSDPPALLLRRLANPHLPANDPADPTSFNATLGYVNPYLTVDVVRAVPLNGKQVLNDAVRVAQDSNRPGKKRGGANATLPPTIDQRTSFGRVEPFAGSTALTLPQNPQPPETMLPQQTFFRHNYQNTAAAPVGPVAPILGVNTETIIAPFDWMVHLDRPAVNPLEVTFAPVVPSHQLTEKFITPTAVPGAYLKHGHLAPWTAELAAGLTVNYVTGKADTVITPGVTAGIVDAAALYRAQELLSVKPWTYGIPNAGRVPGKININLITDPRVLYALADPQSGNYFSQLSTNPLTATPNDPNNTIFDPTDYANPNTIFGRLMAARANQPANSASFTPNAYDPVFNTVVKVQIPGPNDTPIRSFGSALPNSLDPTAFPFTNPTVYPNAQGSNSTPGRTVTDTSTATPKEVGVFSLPNTAHPYLQQELLRKIQNNLTTTSDTFAVYMTVGFFEVTNTGPYNVNTRPLLGKELFKDMPGDLRQKYYAVIDRSNLSIDGTDPTFRTQGPAPFITELVTPMQATPAVPPPASPISIIAQGGVNGATGSLTLQYEGQVFPVVNGTQLRIGTGATAEIVQVLIGQTAQVNYAPATGIGTIYISRGPNQPAHAAGDRVMNNVIPGNPGPQSGFNPNAPNYQAVVPYFGRIE